MSKQKDNKKSVVDFSKLDASIEVLLGLVNKQREKKYTDDAKSKTSIKMANCVKKKLNTELIRDIIMEAKKNKKHKN